MSRPNASFVAALALLATLALAPAAAAQGPAPSSYDRIAAARDRGEITPARAILLGLQSLTAPARVPARFRGRGQADAGAVLADLAPVARRLTPAQRRAIRPWLLPPRARQSAWVPERLRGLPSAPRAGGRELAGDACGSIDLLGARAWTRVAAGAGATVWYPTDRPAWRASATRYAGELRTRILPTLTRLFRAPLATSAAGCRVLGGGGLDVYVGEPAVIDRVADGRG